MDLSKQYGKCSHRDNVDIKSLFESPAQGVTYVFLPIFGRTMLVINSGKVAVEITREKWIF